MVMPPTLWRMNRVPSIPDILSAFKLIRDGAVDNLAGVHDIFPEDGGKVACEVRVERRLRASFALEHGGVVAGRRYRCLQL